MLGNENMRDFKSNEEFFVALRDLMGRIEKQGNVAAAKDLRSGFSCLNGLTDGWALLMESMERTIAANQGTIAATEMLELRDMLKVVSKVVYRR
jgi:hypothetical protein